MQTYVSLDQHVMATPTASGYVLRSTPHFVSNAGNASFYVVIAHTGTVESPEGSYTAFTVDKHWLGVSIGSRVSLSYI